MKIFTFFIVSAWCTFFTFAQFGAVEANNGVETAENSGRSNAADVYGNPPSTRRPSVESIEDIKTNNEGYKVFLALGAGISLFCCAIFFLYCLIRRETCRRRQNSVMIYERMPEEPVADFPEGSV